MRSKMIDTAPEIEALYREKLMSVSNEERFMMGSRMFDAARTMIIASFPPDISESELRQRLFLRIYGDDFDDKTRQMILETIKRKCFEESDGKKTIEKD